MSRLTSSGLADTSDPRVLGQLRDKHLPRHGALPEVAHLDDAVDLNQKLGMLPRRSGTGSDMLPNEHLTLVHARLPGQRGRRSPHGARARALRERAASCLGRGPEHRSAPTTRS